MFNPSKKMAVDCYVDAYFTEVWGRENTQDTFFSKIRTLFVATFASCPIFWVSKLQTYTDLSTLNSYCC